MQQYRVNFPLLIGLGVGLFVSSGAVYALWSFQINRNADALIVAAEKAAADGDLETAAREYGNYLSIRSDDDQVRVKMANVWADVTEQDEVAPENWGRAINVLEQTMRNLPNEKELRRRLVDFYSRIDQIPVALDHLSWLLASDPDNPELQVLQTQLLVRAGKMDDAIKESYKLVGYDKESDSFDADKAIAPDKSGVYGTLAMLERFQNEDPELADRVMDQLVKVNPDSAKAYLERGRYYVNINEPEKGQRDIDKAYRLAPDDADVLLSVGDRSHRNDNVDQARDYFTRGKEKYPEDSRFYQVLSDLEVRQQNFDAALAVIEEGLKAVPRRESQMLLITKVDLQLRAGDVKGVRDTLEQMRSMGFRREYVEYMEARILLSQGKWFDGQRALRRLAPKFVANADLTTQITFYLGFCYEKLGQYDRALAAYDQILQQNPLYDPASAGRQRILARVGRPSDDGSDRQLQNLVNAELAKPKSERDWTAIDAQITEFAEENAIEGVRLDMLWAEMMIAREDFAKARQHVQDAYRKAPDDVRVPRLAIKVLRLDPNAGPAKAMQLLDQVMSQPKFGDLASLRLDRADLILASDSEINEKKEQIAKLAQAPSDWTDEQKVELWDGLATRFILLGMRDEAAEYWNRVADLQPEDLATRMRLFTLALDANDDAGMQAAQEKILELVKSKNDSNWLYTEARRLMSLFRRAQLDKSVLPDVRLLVDKALKLRPDWQDLHLVKAEIELNDGNEDLALKHLEQAQKLGRANPQATLQHVRLLLRRGQLESAKVLVEQLPEEMREDQVAQVYAEILLNLGSIEEAAETARKFVELAEDDAARQLWFGQLLVRGSTATDLTAEQRKALLDEAAEALEKSVERGPDSADAWMALIALRVGRGETAAAQEAMRQAQLVLPDDLLIGVLGRSFEITKHWFDAENVYLTAYRANPDNLAVVRQLANFYLGPSYQRPDRVAKTTPLINKILRAAAEGKIPSTDGAVAWARRIGAQLLASTKEYQQLKKAEDLLRSNAQDGKLSLEDRLKMAEILAPRPEPESRFKALALLKQVDDEQRLSLQGDLTMGQLYFAVGQWRDCRRKMLETISRYPDSAEARINYANMILQHGDERYYGDASGQVDELRKIAATNAQTIDLMVRVAGKTGKAEQARASLLQLIPRKLDEETVKDEQLPMFEFIASLLVQLEDLDNAETLYRYVASRDPKRVYVLANFLGQHRDVGQSMEMLEQAYRPETAELTVRVALAVDRRHRDEVGEKYDEQIEGWLHRALLENPDAIQLQMLLGEFEDLRKHYDAAGEVYQKLLTRQELTGELRAIVLNNLAFLIALAGSDAEVGLDPLQLVQEAADILGPTADILDTRAVIYTARGEYQKAIHDLAYSVTDKPTAAKYFHKAVAHLEAGENTAALESWEKAEELGDIRGELNRLEFDRFDDAQRKIEQLRDERRQLTDNDRLRRAS